MAAAEEERFSRKKHDNGFPSSAIAFCLQQAGITSQDLDYVIFYEKPLAKFGRILSTTLGTFPHSWRVFCEAMISYAKEKIWIKDLIQRHLGVPDSRLLFVDHHVSHAASSFLCSPFKEAAILTADGVGEWTTASIGRGTADWQGGGRSSITLESEIRFPHSIGILYSAFTAFLGFEVNEGEYKVMGMAPYGEPEYLDKIRKIVAVESDGSFRLNMDYFAFTNSVDQTYSSKFLDLFGPPRASTDEFFTRRTHPKADHPNWSAPTADQNKKYADIAASIQRVTEEILLRMANEAHRRTGLKQLCMAGGVALNSVANGRILNETPFEELYIQPAAGDSGGALGAALYANHVLLGRPRRFVMEHAYRGKEYSMTAIDEFISSNDIESERFDNPDQLIDRVTEGLLGKKVVGWFQGRFEWGPRALGNRSILADPRCAEMKEIVNTKIKYREPFRPFAPVVLEERSAEYFTLQDAARHYPARFMLLVDRFQDGKGELVPAVNHEGTGRLQTIRRDTNPLYYDVVKRFGDATGVPILMNTSFNLRGEPIVASPADAHRTFVKSGLDVLVLGNHVVLKRR